MDSLSMEVSMTAIEKIEDLLRRNPGRAYCDDCLSTVLNIRPRQQVQQKPVAWPTTFDFGVAKESAKDAGEKGK